MKGESSIALLLLANWSVWTANHFELLFLKLSWLFFLLCLIDTCTFYNLFNLRFPHIHFGVNFVLLCVILDTTLYPFLFNLLCLHLCPFRICLLFVFSCYFWNWFVPLSVKAINSYLSLLPGSARYSHHHPHHLIIMSVSSCITLMSPSGSINSDLSNRIWYEVPFLPVPWSV